MLGIAISFLTLSLAALLTIAMLPIGMLQTWEWFPGSQEVSLWLLFLMCLFFGLVVFALRSEELFPRKLSTTGGILFLVIGVVLGVEILLIQTCLVQACRPGTAPPPDAVAMISLWLLFVACTLLGAIGVYVAKRMERMAEEQRALEERQAETARAGERSKERLTFVRYVRR